MIQILQSDTNPNNCYLFTRWGRVGVAGQNSNIGPMPPMAAVSNYNSKYYEKARKGGYQEI
jgi:predicted DNA-binding WGR domain protein